MELPKDWARIQQTFEEEQFWRSKGELAIRQEMERRLEAYFARKASAAVPLSLPPLRPRLVDMGTTGHLNRGNRLNRDRALAGLPRQREINQMRREAALDTTDDPEDIRIWRPNQW